MRVTLDALQAEVNETYQPLELEVSGDKVITLQALLLLPKAKRDEFQKKAKLLNSAAEAEADPSADTPDVDVEAEIVNLLALVADDPAAWRKHFGKQPIGMLKLLMEKYMETTQTGEASGSPS